MPRYNGDISLFPEYESRAKGFAATKKDDDQHLVGPELYNELYDTAWARVKEIDASTFRVKEGHLKLLELLRPDFGSFPHIQAGESVDEFFYGLARERTEDATRYSTRFNTALTKMLTQVRLEEDREHKKDFEKSRQDHTLKMFEYRQAMTEYRDEVSRRQADANVEEGVDDDPFGTMTFPDLPVPVRPVILRALLDAYF